jgi:hypothetical protein
MVEKRERDVDKTEVDGQLKILPGTRWKLFAGATGAWIKRTGLTFDPL